MRLDDLARALSLERLTPPSPADGGDADQDVTRGYASDLLSDVLARAPAGGVLVTLQVHLNVIAVASHAGLRAVIFASGRTPVTEVVERAAEEGLVLFRSGADTFEIVGRLYQLGLRGSLP
jgi:hypothetical protein